MKKLTIALMITAVLLSAAAAGLIIGELMRPQPVYEYPHEEKQYDEELYARFIFSEAAGDYIAMNDLYDQNLSETGVPFPVEDYDPTHGGLIYTYPFSVKIPKDKTVSGTLYFVSAELDLEPLSYGEADYIAIDRRDRSDPEVVVLDSYRAEDTAVIRRMCEILLDHEKAHPTDWERTLNSMVEEWQIHNAAYFMDYQVNRSKDVNLNNADENTDWFARALKEVAGP